MSTYLNDLTDQELKASTVGGQYQYIDSFLMEIDVTPFLWHLDADSLRAFCSLCHTLVFANVPPYPSLAERRDAKVESKEQPPYDFLCHLCRVGIWWVFAWFRRGGCSVANAWDESAASFDCWLLFKLFSVVVHVYILQHFVKDSDIKERSDKNALGEYVPMFCRCITRKRRCVCCRCSSKMRNIDRIVRFVEKTREVARWFSIPHYEVSVHVPLAPEREWSKDFGRRGRRGSPQSTLLTSCINWSSTDLETSLWPSFDQWYDNCISRLFQLDPTADPM